MTPAECALASNRAVAGKDLASGGDTLSTGLVALWHLGNCTGSGATLSCPESSGSGAPALSLDLAAPTVAILTPAAGTVSGSVSMTASCSDVVACSSVAYFVDGYQVSQVPPASAPFTFAWDSTKFADGTHVITAIGTNISGTTGTSNPVTVTSSNGVANVAFYFSPSGSGTACTIGAPCAITSVNTPPGSRAYYIGGDHIYLQSVSAGGAFTLSTTGISICGSAPQTDGTLAFGARTDGSNFLVGFGCGQNYYFGALPLTITSYGAGTCAVQSGTVTGCAEDRRYRHHADDRRAGSTTRRTRSSRILRVVNLNTTCGAIVNGCYGIIATASSGAPLVTGSIIQANEVQDFPIGIMVYSALFSQNCYFGNGSPGGTYVSTCQIVSNVLDNYIHGSSTSAPVDTAISLLAMDGGGTISGNYINNYPGHINSAAGYAGGCCGNGITMELAYHQTSPITTIQYNVITNMGQTNNNCGGPASIETASVFTYSLIQFNEVAYSVPNTYRNGVCDNDAIDLDANTLNVTVQYNYTHNNAGAAFNVFSNGTWGNTTWRYNVSENDAFYYLGPFAWYEGGISPSYIYNNTVYFLFSGNGTSEANCVQQYGGAPINFYNNICVYGLGSGAARIINTTAGFSAPGGSLLDYNIYYATGSGTLNWRCVENNNIYATFAAWQAGCPTRPGSPIAFQDQHSVVANPNLTGTFPAGNAYTALSGTPAGPQPFPSAYKLSTTASPAIGTGGNLNSIFGINVGTRDYYGNTIPHGHGTGFNIGADGGYP